MKNHIFLLTVDVEGIPLQDGHWSYSTIIEGIPLLLDLFREFDISSTFFVTSDAAKNTSEVLREIIKGKHEIGCHSSGAQNYTHLKMTAETIRKHLNVNPVSFRAHRYKINGETLTSLIRLGYKYDSSVVSSSRVFNRQYSPNSPKTPYHPSIDNIYEKGDSPLIEIPISALPIIKLPLGLSYIKLFGLGLYKLFLSKLNQKTITMYLHPYDLFQLPPKVDSPLNFAVANKRRAKGFEILRGLLKYLEERLSPTYIPAREILDHRELLNQKRVESAISTAQQYT